MPWKECDAMELRDRVLSRRSRLVPPKLKAKAGGGDGRTASRERQPASLQALTQTQGRCELHPTLPHATASRPRVSVRPVRVFMQPGSFACRVAAGGEDGALLRARERGRTRRAACAVSPVTT
jgi:hypothetical protein